ncbi:MAG: hypothetical protein EXR75_04100 [Myxococcales bacterium]|nr:hypothetical protein [Myxococcales bacterium]
MNAEPTQGTTQGTSRGTKPARSERDERVVRNKPLSRGDTMTTSTRSLPPPCVSDCPRPPPPIDRATPLICIDAATPRVRIDAATPRVPITDAMPHIIDGGHRLWHALARCLPLEDVLALGVRIHRQSEGALSRDDWWTALVDGLAAASEPRLA